MEFRTAYRIDDFRPVKIGKETFIQSFDVEEIKKNPYRIFYFRKTSKYRTLADCPVLGTETCLLSETSVDGPFEREPVIRHKTHGEDMDVLLRAVPESVLPSPFDPKEFFEPVELIEYGVSRRTALTNLARLDRTKFGEIRKIARDALHIIRDQKESAVTGGTPDVYRTVIDGSLVEVSVVYNGPHMPVFWARAFGKERDRPRDVLNDLGIYGLRSILAGDCDVALDFTIRTGFVYGIPEFSCEWSVDSMCSDQRVVL